MRALDDAVALAIDELPFFLRVAAPQHEHELFTLLGKCAYQGIGKLLPTTTLVGTRLPLLDTQNAVEQAHTLIGPTLQFTVRCRFDTDIALKLGVDVSK